VRTTDPTAAECWARAGALFEAARGLPLDARRALLDDYPDRELRAQIETLLQAHDRMEGGSAGTFLERLDPRRAAPLLYGADADEDIVPGALVGRYRVLRRLGSGGMGVVYLAHDPRLDRNVALKLLPPHRSTDPVARRRFEQEARAASALDHPNIVTVHEIGDAPDGRFFIAMALCEGPTLRETLDAKMLPVARAVAFATQIADGLGAAHGRGVVHRDVKPRNIIITPGGVPRIVDFGVATTRAGDAAGDAAGAGPTPGTLAYMSPEQTGGETVDARTDVWALGVLLYEMLAGRRPFDGDDAQRLAHAIRHEDPEPLRRLRPDAPAALCRIVDRCLSRDLGQRPADANVVAAELRALGVQSAARRTRVTMVAGVALAIAGAAVGLRAMNGAQPRLEPRRVAVAPFENRSGAPDLDGLASMATEWVTHGLWQTGVIQVVPLAPYGATGEEAGSSPRTVARDAGARLLLTASLYRQQGVARLQAHVIDVADGSVVESIEPVNAPIDAPLEATEELRRRVQSVLNARLDTQLTHVAAAARPPTLEAYREYLAGRDRHAARDLTAALTHFQRAAALDSTFLLPHAISAIVLNMMGRMAAADSIVRQLEARADELDALTRAHVAWLRGGLVGDRHARAAGMREAARLAPGSTLVSYQFADETLRLGRPREAVRILDAVEPERGELRGWLHYWQVLCAGLHLQGNHRRELREARRARALYPGDTRALLLEAHALAALGRTRDIDRMLADAGRTVPGEPGAGALMLATALELRAHARGTRASSAADRLLERAVAWYGDLPAARRTVRSRYEHALALGLLGRRTEARQQLAQLVVERPSPVGPSPIGARGSPHYPGQVTYRGVAGLFAAMDGDSAAARAALSWLERSTESYSHGRPTYWRAAITASLGDQEAAVRLLRRALEEGMPYSLSVHQAPELAALRGNRSFRAMFTERP
jgi:TolB-like protein